MFKKDNDEGLISGDLKLFSKEEIRKDLNECLKKASLIEDKN